MRQSPIRLVTGILYANNSSEISIKIKNDYDYRVSILGSEKFKGEKRDIRDKVL